MRGQIYTLDDSNDGDSRKDVLFGGSLILLPILGVKYLLTRLCKVGLLTSLTVKKFILKTVKSPYICNHLTDFD